MGCGPFNEDYNIENYKAGWLGFERISIEVVVA
jgi:hypothetical protein